ncbi:TAXI family TRAP transporter solute-binding subunit [Thalassospira sp. UBA1131]|uniref:TAXI family TRAP transporter solute-binding subunit n=1 Tax=Thalassospira sp. UBA1131 TaxID=1947672 RepID=UPI0025CBBCFB|nr:TAXI family TRAP transporter solute-binding subunit [Thalassospira sp. UBA1131]
MLNNMFKITGLIAGTIMSLSSAASAQVLSVGTTEGGAVAQLGAAVSNVVSSHSDYQMRPQAMAGTQQYMTGVDMGRIDFGISNSMQYYMGVSGTMLSEGQPHENLRVVATLAPFVQGVIVTNKSGVSNVAELAGMRIPAGYNASPLFEYFWDAFLAGSNMSRDDVSGVPVTSLPNSWQAFREGQVDAVIAAAGSAAVREMNATIDGGIRYIPLEPDAKMMAALPKTRIEVVEPAEGLDGIEVPTGLHVYETVLFAHKDVSEDAVYAVTRALAENEAALKASGPLWSNYSTKQIHTDFELEYHPGALRYYEEAGLSAK